MSQLSFPTRLDIDTQETTILEMKSDDIRTPWIVHLVQYVSNENSRLQTMARRGSEEEERKR